MVFRWYTRRVRRVVAGAGRSRATNRSPRWTVCMAASLAGSGSSTMLPKAGVAGAARDDEAPEERARRWSSGSVTERRAMAAVNSTSSGHFSCCQSLDKLTFIWY